MKITSSSRLVSTALALSLLVGITPRPAQAASLPSFSSIKDKTIVSIAAGGLLCSYLGRSC